MMRRPFWVFAAVALAGIHSPAVGQVAPHDPTSIIGSLGANGSAATFSEPGVGFLTNVAGSSINLTIE